MQPSSARPQDYLEMGVPLLRANRYLTEETQYSLAPVSV